MKGNRPSLWENPHQKAAFYKEIGKAHGMGALKQLHGKELSYNNIVDMEAAWNMVWSLQTLQHVSLKHTNPCGAATAATLHDAYVMFTKQTRICLWWYRGFRTVKLMLLLPEK